MWKPEGFPIKEDIMRVRAFMAALGLTLTLLLTGCGGGMTNQTFFDISDGQRHRQLCRL